LNGLSAPLACGGAAVVALVALIPPRIAGACYLNNVSGAWAAMADDFAHGVLYRPLVSSLGLGGTRYFPLHPVLHGLLERAGIGLRPGGHLLSLLGAGLLVAGGALGLARWGAPRAIAVSAGLLALASRTAFIAVAGIRGDILPVGLAVMGLALLPRERGRSVLPAAALLSLSLLTKQTVVWAPAGAAVALIVVGAWGTLARLAGAVAALTLAGIAGAFWLSHGEMLASFRAVATAGGLSVAYLRSLGYARPGEVIWALGGPLLTVFRGRRAFANPLCAAGFISVPVTILMFLSPGLHVNHLVDATALGALAAGAAFADEDVRRWAKGVLIAGTVFGLAEAALLDGIVIKPGELDQAAAALPAGTAPVLSDNPWVPLLAGERAFALDAYAVQQTRNGSPTVTRALLGGLDECRFRAVVLMGRVDRTGSWYEVAAFGPGFREHLERSYSLAGVEGAHAFYLPRCGQAPALPSRPLTGGETIADRSGRPSRLQALLCLWRER
jgi:hypothetical protein